VHDNLEIITNWMVKWLTAVSPVEYKTSTENVIHSYVITDIFTASFGFVKTWIKWCYINSTQRKIVII
jgi:hypothetical protein